MKKQTYFLLFLGVFAFIIRISFISKTGAQASPDGLLYSNVAINLLQGRGLIQTIRPYEFIVPPLYPLFLSFIYLIFGEGNYLAAVIVHSIFSVLTCILIYFIGKKIFNIKIGILSSLYFAIYPISIWWNSFFLTESLYTFFLVFFTWYLVRLFSKTNITKKELLFAGIIWGVCNLVRPNIIFFLPFLLLWIYLARKKEALKYFLLITLGMVIIIAPWILYTYMVHGLIVPIGSYGTEQLWLGNSEFTDPDVCYSNDLYINNQKFQEIRQRVENLTFHQKETIYLDEIKNFIISQPLKFITNFFNKIVTFWRPVALNIQVFGSNTLVKTANHFINNLYGFLVYFIPVGILLTLVPTIIRSDHNFLIIFLLIYYSSLVSSTIVVCGARYRIPIMPLSIMYMFFPVIKIIELLDKRFALGEKASVAFKKLLS